MSTIAQEEQERIETVDPSRGAKAFHESYKDRSIDVSRPFQERSWNVRATRNDGSERYGGLKTLITVGTFLTVSAGTLAIKDPLHIACAWLAALSIMVAVDGLHFFGRFLAFQSRLILSIMAALLAGCIEIPTRNLILLTVIVSIFGSALVRSLNSKWLSAENFRMTKIGRDALASVEHGLLNKSTSAWQGYGKQEVVRMLYELGIECTEEALDVIHKAVWLAGYLHAYEKTARLRTKEEHVDKMRDDLAKARNEIIQLKEDLRIEKAKNRQHIDAAQDARDEAASASNQIRLLRLQISGMKKEHDNLLQTNEELVQCISQPVALGQTQDDKVALIRSYMDAGLSQNKAGEMLGLSKATTSRLLSSAKGQDQ